MLFSKVRFVALAASHVGVAFVLHGCGGGGSVTTTTVAPGSATTTMTLSNTGTAAGTTTLTTTTSTTYTGTTTTSITTTSTTTTTTSTSTTSTTTTTTRTTTTSTTTTTTSTTTPPNPEDQAVADAVNALYKRSDTGVNMHVFDKTEDPSSPWLACLTASAGCSWQPLGRLSAVILNHFAWNDAKKQITTFGTMNTVGMIGTESVTKNLTNCIFPGDGGSMTRSHAGCGCTSTHPKPCKDGWDWCPEFSVEWDGVCAMHPDMLPEMLTQFKQRGFPYNEAVVDGKKWNDDVSNNLRAFVVPTGSMGACGMSTKCYTDFVSWYRSYKRQHGRKSILGFDVTNQNRPFAPFPEPADLVVV